MGTKASKSLKRIINIDAYKRNAIWEADEEIITIFSPAMTINGIKLHSVETGNVKIDIKKNGTSICGSSLPEIDSGTDYSDMELTDWATTIAEWDQLTFEIVSCTDIKNFVIGLSVQISQV